MAQGEGAANSRLKKTSSAMQLRIEGWKMAILDLPFSIFVHENQAVPIFSPVERSFFARPIQVFLQMDKVRLIRHVLCQCCRSPVFESGHRFLSSRLSLLISSG